MQGSGDGSEQSETIYQANQMYVLSLCERALRDDGVVFYSSKVRIKGGVAINPRRWIDGAGFYVIQEIIWNRINTANGDPRRFRPVYETIYVLAKRPAVQVGKTPAFRLNNPGKESGGNGWPDVWDINPKAAGQDRKKIGHPASVPFEIVRRCLEVAPTPNGLTCDPYCGTGTTGAAAIHFGGQYLLSDISLEWATKTEERMNELQTMRKPGDKEN